MLDTDQIVHHLSNRRMHVVVLPTERCNFRCVYCYEDFAIGKMRPEVVDGLCGLLAHRIPDLDVLTLSWFGGEPLLAKDLVLRVSRHAEGVARTTNPDLSIVGKMTTNGFFLDLETAKVLADVRIREFQISLDGWAEAHDKTRVLAGGRGTFGRIMANIGAIANAELAVDVVFRLHFTRASLDDAPELLRRLRDVVGSDRRFHVFPKAIHRLGGPNDSKLDVLSAQQEDQHLAAVRQEATNLGLQVLALGADEPYVCYAAAGNSLVVRPDGTLAKCTVALYEDHNRIGRLHSDGTVTVDSERLRPWLEGLLAGDATTASCPLEHVRRQTAGPMSPSPPRSPG